MGSVFHRSAPKRSPGSWRPWFRHRTGHRDVPRLVCSPTDSRAATSQKAHKPLPPGASQGGRHEPTGTDTALRRPAGWPSVADSGTGRPGGSPATHTTNATSSTAPRRSPARSPSRPSSSPCSPRTPGTATAPRPTVLLQADTAMAQRSVYGRISPVAARRAALTHTQVTTPLASRPYDLRHSGHHPQPQRGCSRARGRQAGRSRRRGPAPGLRRIHRGPRDTREPSDRRRSPR